VAHAGILQPPVIALVKAIPPRRVEFPHCRQPGALAATLFFSLLKGELIRSSDMEHITWKKKRKRRKGLEFYIHSFAVLINIEMDI
jgi:hypothetical protein